VNRFTPDAAARLSVPTHPAPATPAAPPEAKRGITARARDLLKPGSAPLAPPEATTPGGPPPNPRRDRKLTPLKRLERYISAIFKLGRTEGMAKDARKRVTAAELRMDAIEGELGKFGQDIRQSRDRGDQLEILSAALEDKASMDEVHHLADRINQQQDCAEAQARDLRTEITTRMRAAQAETALLARLFSDLTRRIDRLAPGTETADTHLSARAAAPVSLPASDGFDLFKDSFYHRLENRYRGTVEEITRRLSIYLPDVEAAYLRTGRKPAMDIGCGRGEWLGLLQKAGIDAFGVDTNEVQIQPAREAGLDMRQGDALVALAEMEDASLSVLTAHHLVEHLPFDAVAWITREAMRVLAPGGVLLFETPNTRNVLVGATTFHTDPTHLKPMPEQVLGVLFETAGFDPVDIRHLHPHDRMGEFLATPDFNDELAFLMFGPQDLAVLGTRPEKD
jgi:O-antigen chain-terminating methyltransferase